MQKGIGAIITLVGGILLACALGGGFLLYQNYSKSQIQKSIVDFDSCVKAGNPVTASYPGICRTSDGRSFVQPLTDEEKKKLIPPSDDDQNDEMANWKAYINEKIGVEFKYPGWELIDEEINDTQSIVRFEVLGSEYIFEKTQSTDSSVAPYLKTNNKKNINGVLWSIVTPSDDSKYCDAGDCASIRPVYYTFRDGYMYGLYYPGDTADLVEKVLGTFRFL